MFKLISIDNQISKGSREVGKTNEFNYDGNVFHFGSIQSSRVKSIIAHQEVLIVVTQNTLYTFINKGK